MTSMRMSAVPLRTWLPRRKTFVPVQPAPGPTAHTSTLIAQCAIDREIQPLPSRPRRYAGLLLSLLLAACLPHVCFAEPYLAVRAGQACATCHVNPGGGGMRNNFGTLWGQTTLPARTLTPSGAPWTGEFGQYVAIGANLRTDATLLDQPGAEAASSLDLRSLRAYLNLRVIPGRLDLYLDQRLAPGTSSNAEAWLRLNTLDRRFYLRAGQMYLPFGLRLQDDGAFIRERTNISFNTPDRGIEAGFNGTRWNAQLAVSNGTAGAAEVDQGKQWSLRSEYVQPRWRAGASFNYNDFDGTSRRMHGVFAGLRTGPIAWLAEVDAIIDSGPGPDSRGWAGLVEANWLVRKGHNLKLTAERHDPDRDAPADRQSRLSLVWEYTPIPFLQLRTGLRQYDDDAGLAFQNQRLIFMQLHGYL
jgi:hypothetical protein